LRARGGARLEERHLVALDRDQRHVAARAQRGEMLAREGGDLARPPGEEGGGARAPVAASPDRGSVGGHQRAGGGAPAASAGGGGGVGVPSRQATKVTGFRGAGRMSATASREKKVPSSRRACEVTERTSELPDAKPPACGKAGSGWPFARASSRRAM